MEYRLCWGHNTGCDLPWLFPLGWRGGHRRVAGVALPSRRELLLPRRPGSHHSSTSPFPFHRNDLDKEMLRLVNSIEGGKKGIFTVPLLLEPPLPALAKSPKSLPSLSFSAVLLALVGLPLPLRRSARPSPAPERDCRHHWPHTARVLNGASHSCTWRTFSIGTGTASRCSFTQCPPGPLSSLRGPHYVPTVQF